MILWVALIPALVMATADQTVRLAHGGIALSGVQAKRSETVINVAMLLRPDSLKMSANRRIVLTPMLVGQHDSLALRPIVINGHRQQVMYNRRDYLNYAGALVVDCRKAIPQQIDYRATADYADWMRSADLTVREDLCGCGNVADQTSTLVKHLRRPRMPYIRPVTTGLKTYELKGRAYIDFPVNRTELHPDYRNNPRELAKIVDTINVVRNDANMTITNIDIHGYASPESPYDHNAYLAEHRAATLKNYVRQLVHLDDSLFTVHFTPEDWNGLCQYLADSNIDHRDEILQIADRVSDDPDEREAEIKRKYPEEYRFMLATWYPALRHSDYIISCTVRPFSVDEAKALIKTRPQLLSQDEMYQVAQTYEPGSKEFNEVMEIAVRMFPDDPTANLNAACTRLDQGDAAGAKPYLDKAGDSLEAQEARNIYEELK